MSNKNELSGTADPHRRIDFLVGFINKMVRRIDLLENARDAKVEPISPPNEWYVAQYERVSRENELLKHDIQCFKDDYANGHKIRMDLTNNLIKERDDLLKTVADKQKVLDGEKAAAIKLEESSTYWQQKYNKQLQETDFLNKRLDFFEKMSYDLEMEKNDAKWYREQAIKKCIDIVERIKNDPLTVGDGKRWMVAICEDIQRAIKKEFGVK